MKPKVHTTILSVTSKNMMSVLFYFTKGSKGKQVGMPSCNKTAFFIRFQKAF